VDLLAPVRWLDRTQSRHEALAVPLAVVKKFGDDGAGNLAALVAYYAFFSLFPLLLVMTTILGFVLHGNAKLQHDIVNSVLGQIPVIGDQLRARSLTGSVPALVIGLLFSLLGGLGVVVAAQNAFDQVWAVPRKDRPDFFMSRVRGLAVISMLGLLFLIASVITGFTSGIHGPLGKLAAVFLGFVVNLGLFAAAFRFLTSPAVPMRQLWVGVVLGAAFWTALQFFGGLYINHVVRRASLVGGQFALVLGLLVWLHLGAQMTLYAAETNVVLARKLWPRSLIGPPDDAADEKTLAALAKAEQRHDTEQVEVRFRH
jgi:uncharacterized BrkB/YihY/UPF0761 family membrane protein